MTNRNRVTRRQAQSFLAPMRRAIAEMRTGEVDAVHGYAVTRLPTHAAAYARLDYCLAGTRAFMERLAPHIDCAPLERVEKKLAHGTPLTMAELSACQAVLRQIEDALVRMDRRAVQDALVTTQIAIEVEALGMQEAAA